MFATQSWTCSKQLLVDLAKVSNINTTISLLIRVISAEPLSILANALNLSSAWAFPSDVRVVRILFTNEHLVTLSDAGVSF